MAYLLVVLPIDRAPTVIAMFRRHNNLAPIIVVDILLGRVFVGWVIALAWSLSDIRPMRTERPV